MDQKFKILTLLILIGAFAYKSCKKGDNVSADANAKKGIVDREILLAGEWKVSYFKLNGSERTIDFDHDKFRFDKNGNVVVTNDKTNMIGTWTIGANDDPSSFVLQFNNSAIFSQLNGEWNIQRVDKVMFDTDRPGKTRSLTDVLHFERIVDANTSPVKEHIP